MAAPRPIALILLLALAGCAPRTEWVKESAGAGDLRRDREDCQAQTGRSGFATGQSPAANVEDEARNRHLAQGTAELFADCMRARGWRRERPQPKA